MHTGLHNIHCARGFLHWTDKYEQAFVKLFTEETRMKFMMKREGLLCETMQKWVLMEVCVSVYWCRRNTGTASHATILWWTRSSVSMHVTQCHLLLFFSSTSITFFFHSSKVGMSSLLGTGGSVPPSCSTTCQNKPQKQQTSIIVTTQPSLVLRLICNLLISCCVFQLHYAG